MFADKALRCDCGYEVQASDEAGRVHEVRKHASEAHGIDLPEDVALDLVRRARLAPRGERGRPTREEWGGACSSPCSRRAKKEGGPRGEGEWQENEPFRSS